MKKKWYLGLLAVAATTLVACSSQTTQTKANTENKFTYAIGGDPTSSNPINTSDRWGLTMANMIYSPLIRIEADGSHKFELAESLDVSPDGTKITVKLRKDVKWSDGEAFNADDVVFTYTELAKKENGNSSKMYINDAVIAVEKVDDYTVVFTLPEASAATIENLATEKYILPEHAYKGKDLTGKELPVSHVGTGAYKLVEYKRGEYMQFEANEHFYGGKPSIDKVILQIIPSADTQKLALQKGEVDAAVVLPSDVADLNKDSITTYPYSENRVGYMGLNTATSELQDKKVRQAILFALNKDDMNKAAYLNDEYYVSPNSILPPNNPYATTNVEKYTQNLEKAKALLQEAGVTNLTLKLGYSATDPAQTLQATLIQQQLQQVGVTVELAGGDSSAIFTELRKKGSTQYHLFLGGYIMGNDPDLYAALFAPGARANYFQYNSEKVAELFDKGAKELDDAKRKAIYEELQQVIADDAVIYPIVDNRRILAVNSRIQGVKEAGLVPIYSLEDMSKLSVKK
ncbi:ABC transporter substrate-binding protein [Carnobacteriaceae bacterium zg-C25]|nr:ABC transporter substrate-binding protein [Carnobacteriaceae bacterium zg-C25]